MNRRFALVATAFVLFFSLFASVSHAQTSDGLRIVNANTSSTASIDSRLSAASTAASVASPRLGDNDSFWVKYTDGKYELAKNTNGNTRIENNIRDEPKLSMWEKIVGADGGGTAQVCTGGTPLQIVGYWQPATIYVEGVPGETSWMFIVTGFTGGEPLTCF